MSLLLCSRNTHTQPLPAKVYSAPLNLKETPLTYAVNLSARLGNEVRPLQRLQLFKTNSALLDLDQARRPPAGIFIQDSRRLQHDGESVRRRKEKRCHHLLCRYAAVYVLKHYTNMYYYY